jgi:PAS domain S-box-containing protein
VSGTEDPRADPARLAALRESGLLDSAPEEAFDALTRLAARLVRVPASFISLVDEDRDFYKSCVGFGEPLATVRQLEGTTFCHYAIVSPGPLVIPDTAADPLYREVPTVRSLGVAAYLGIPIRTGEGEVLGSFCAIDFVPRPWTADEIETMTVLAASAEREIEVRRRGRETEALLRQLQEQQAELEQQVEEAQTLNEELERSEARARALLDSAAEGIYGMDLEGRCTFINPAGERMLGYAPGELLGREMHSLIHHTRADGTPYPAAECPIGRVARTGTEARLESERLWRKDGTSFAAEYAAAPMREAGEVTGAVVSFLDITARRVAEAERARMAAVVESSADFIGIATPDGRTAYLNAAGRRLVGLGAAEDALRTAVADFFFPEDLPLLEGTILPAAVREGRWRGEVRFRHFGTGAAIPVLYELFRITEPVSGRLLALATVTRDLTERERLLSEAQHARGEAERANQAKSQFLANMSHEIRTPINAIIGYSDLLDAGVAGPLAPPQQDYLGRVRRSSQHLLGLVNDVLDLAKVEAGEMTVLHEEGTVAEAVAAALHFVSPQADERGIELAAAEGCGPEARFLGDEDRVRQILVNLLSNAVKFTGRGGRVAVRCVQHDAQEGVGGGPWLAVEVEDTGMGIAPEQLARVFEPFVQAEGGHTRKHGGTGLGLTISRRFARMMGGDLTVRSRLGAGSCFTLWLPAAERRSAPRTLPASAGEGWPASVRDLPGLGEVGRRLSDGAERVEDALRAALLTDPDVPGARELESAQLGGHAGAFVAAMGRMLEALQERGSSPADLEDTEAILELIATRHGRQRRRLGWKRTALLREYRLLHSLVDEVARAALETVEPDGTLGVVHRILDRAEAASLAAHDRPGEEAPDPGA